MSSTIIIIKDVSWREFKTSHNVVYATVVETVQNVLDSKIAETEEQISFVA